VAATGPTPNAISLLSLGFSAGAAWALVIALNPGTAGRTAAVCFLLAAAGIQLRLLCNLLDGMVAIECGKKSATGGIYNEAPDRLADVILLVAAGQGAGTLWGTSLPLGWLAAGLAVGMACIRVLGGTLTGTQNFMGPMAKQHLWTGVLHLIVLGSVLTCGRRLQEIARLLKAAGAPPES
jgi:phosphatidylglycerophosphate synthase